MFRFYVYEIYRGLECLYIGKGSKYRLTSQINKFKAEGREIARFKDEEDAYSFEREMIAERSPLYNIHPGGNGCRVKKKKKTYYRRTKEEMEMERIGTRKYAAIMLLKKGEANLLKLGVSFSSLDKIRQVANG